MKGMLKKFAEMQASDGFCLSVRVVGSWGGKSTVRSRCVAHTFQVCRATKVATPDSTYRAAEPS